MTNPTNRMVRYGRGFAGALALITQASSARAVCIEVNTTAMEFGSDDQLNGNCALYEAVRMADEGPLPVDGCSAIEGTGAAGDECSNSVIVTIILPPGEFSIQEQLSLQNITVRGAGKDSTTLWNDGLIAPTSVLMGSSATLRHLSVQGRDLFHQPTSGIYIGTDGGAALDHVRVHGFDNGGIINEGSSTIEYSTLENNSASTGGGGLWVIGGDVVVANSAIVNNWAPYGGGVFVQGGHARARYSTIASNFAWEGPGGGIYVAEATLDGIAEFDGFHVTVAYNWAGSGGGGVHMDSTDPGTRRFDGSIIAENMGGGVPSDFVGIMRGLYQVQDGRNRNILGTLSDPPPLGFVPCDAGVEPEDPEENPLICDLVTDPLLGSLGNNGGPTPTIAIDGASPAVDAGLNPPVGGAGDRQRFDSAFRHDQRGPEFPAPVGGTHDIGAFEYNPD